MLFTIYCQDSENSAAARQLHYDDHRAYLKSAHDVTILIAGPLVGRDADDCIGSLIVIDAGSLERARKFNVEDPFAIQGVWASARVTAFVMATDTLSSRGSLAPTPAPSSPPQSITTGAPS
jgi:uncharacterized protein